jgi:hypothetical protein
MGPDHGGVNWSIGVLVYEGASQRRQTWIWWKRRPSSIGLWVRTGGTVFGHRPAAQLDKVKRWFPKLEPKLVERLDLTDPTLLDVLARLPSEDEVRARTCPFARMRRVVDDCIFRAIGPVD